MCEQGFTESVSKALRVNKAWWSVRNKALHVNKALDLNKALRVTARL